MSSSWNKHKSALEALEEGTEIDTKTRASAAPPLPAAKAGGPSPGYLIIEPNEVDRKLLSVESSKATMFKVITGIAIILFIFAITAKLGDEDDTLKKKGEEVEVLMHGANDKRLELLGGIEEVKNAFGKVFTEGESFFKGADKKAKSILMFGPPGCGKTDIAKAAAGTFGYNFIEVTGGKIMTSYVGESGRNIRRYFKMAKDNAPCIIFFDEVETILKKRGSGGGRTGEDDRTVSEFLTEMNSVFGAPEKVFVIGATNLPETLDDAAVRRFHRRLYIPIPGKATRRAILKSKMAKLSDAQLDLAVEKTYGRSSSDLTSCIDGYFNAVIDKIKRKKLKPPAQQIDKKDFPIQTDCFERAILFCKSTVRGSSLPALRQWAKQFGEEPEEEDPQGKGEHRSIAAFDLDDEERKIAERAVTVPIYDQANFRLVSGLDVAKDKLLRAAKLIFTSRKEMREGLITPRKSWLMYGPPGTGKTFIATALAAEAFEATKESLKKEQQHVSFISFSAADIMGKYHGESEQNLQRYFRVAEAYQPSVLFIDEIDSLIKDRSKLAGNDGGAAASIVGVFLQLMEGAKTDPGRQVMVLAATNFPDDVDSAALRRFDALYIPLPGFLSRRDMFMKKVYPKEAKGLQTREELDAFYKTKLEPSDRESLRLLATIAEGYSASDIEKIIKEARTVSYEVFMEQRGGKKSDWDGRLEPVPLKNAFLSVPPTAKQSDVDRIREVAKKNGQLDFEESEDDGTGGKKDKTTKAMGDSSWYDTISGKVGNIANTLGIKKR